MANNRSIPLIVGTLGITATQTWPVPARQAPTLSPSCDLRVVIRWHYTRKGVERPGRTIVRMYFHNRDLLYLVDRIAEFMNENDWYCEPQNARLEIREEDLTCGAGKLLHDIRCSVRVMNKVKKHFSYMKAPARAGKRKP